MFPPLLIFFSFQTLTPSPLLPLSHPHNCCLSLTLTAGHKPVAAQPSPSPLASRLRRSTLAVALRLRCSPLDAWVWAHIKAEARCDAKSEPAIRSAAVADLPSARKRDPACVSFSYCLLNYKGFLACQLLHLSCWWLGGLLHVLRPECGAGLTFVISGTLDSLEREEAEDLIKRHGGRVTGSVSKKTNYLLCDKDIGGRKSTKAKELGTSFLTEDGLFDMIRASKPCKSSFKRRI